jgi:hypothetical protein
VSARTAADHGPPVIPPGTSREDSARILMTLHFAQLSAWQRSGDLRQGPAPEREAAFAAAEEISGVYADAMADALQAGYRSPGEEARTMAMRAGVRADDIRHATTREPQPEIRVAELRDREAGS